MRRLRLLNAGGDPQLLKCATKVKLESRKQMRRKKTWRKPDVGFSCTLSYDCHLRGRSRRGHGKVLEFPWLGLAWACLSDRDRQAEAMDTADAAKAEAAEAVLGLAKKRLEIRSDAQSSPSLHRARARRGLRRWWKPRKHRP